MRLNFKILFLVFFLVSFPLFAEVTLPSVFMDNMVLQQKSKVNFWGKANPGEEITVSVSWTNKKYSTTASSSGDWKLLVNTNKGGFQRHTVLVSSSNNSIFLKNVLIGEVWFSSGQSNMEWTMRRVTNAKNELIEANYPNIRLFNVIKKISDTPQYDLPQKSKWQQCDSLNVKEFSAISYYFARELHQKLNIPIGIITANWGGTGAECWTPEETMRTNPTLKNVYNRWQNWYLNKEKDSISFAEATSKGLKLEEPQSIYMTKRPHRQPSVLYNAMVAPLIPFTIKGVIWYHGTSNREWANEYLEQMKALITGWRKNWNQSDLPFYFLQLTAFNYSDSNLASIIRENQLKTLELPYTAMCPTMDIGDLNDLHYPYKLPYGMRLANITLANTYSKKINFCGPLIKKFKVEEDKIEIDFKYGEDLKFTGETLNDIFIAGADRKFVKAQAYIKNDKLIVYSSQISKPLAVRYAWNNTDKANLFNSANLPASPFRTDNWDNIIIE